MGLNLGLNGLTCKTSPFINIYCVAKKRET